MPLCQPQLEIRSITAGSWAMTVIGTSWLASSPLTIVEGWWSPRTMSTRSSSPYVSTKETRVFSEYWIDCPKAALTRSESRHTSSGDSP